MLHLDGVDLLPWLDQLEWMGEENGQSLTTIRVTFRAMLVLHELGQKGDA